MQSVPFVPISMGSNNNNNIDSSSELAQLRTDPAKEGKFKFNVYCLFILFLFYFYFIFILFLFYFYFIFFFSFLLFYFILICFISSIFCNLESNKHLKKWPLPRYFRDCRNNFAFFISFVECPNFTFSTFW